MKEFGKTVKTWQGYRHKFGAYFLEHSV